MAYVMLGRSQKLEDIYILGEVKAKDIKADPDALNETYRLCNEFYKIKEREEAKFNDCFTISYLNINRIKPHLLDVKKDLFIMKSDVISLAETWLQPDEVVSFEEEGFSGVQLNIGNGKGIMAFTKMQDYDSENIRTMSCENFSAIFMKTELADLIFLYLSRGFNWGKLEKLLSLWINNQRSVAVIGDMNIDFIDEDHEFIQYMTRNGFGQLVQEPTHIRGGLLDQIYVNKALMEKKPFSSQNCVSYSDHDKITLHIPLDK